MGNVNKAFFGCVSQQVGWWKKSSLPNECVVGLKSFYQKEFFFLSLMNILLRNHAQIMKKLTKKILISFIDAKKYLQICVRFYELNNVVIV